MHSLFGSSKDLNLSDAGDAYVDAWRPERMLHYQDVVDPIRRRGVLNAVSRRLSAHRIKYLKKFADKEPSTM